MSRLRRFLGWLVPSFALFALACGTAWAQSCETAAEMDITTKASLEQAAQQLFAMSARGDYAGLRAQSMASLASSFSGIEAAVTEHQKDFQGAQASPSGVFLLDAGAQPQPRAEFYCGIFNSPDRVTIVLRNLPLGKYAMVTEAVRGGARPVNLTMILQQSGSAWKLGGYNVNPSSVGGHDATYFLTQARALHGKGANLAAYMYFLQAWELSGPVPFLYTVSRDKIADEMQSTKPADLPTAANPLTLTGGAGKSYRVTQIFPEAVGNDLDLIVKYQAISDLNNTSAVLQDNTAVIKAVVTRYPELRDTFGGVVARAVDASTGRDYGTLLAMKDVK
jgi:hypothetical protein